MSVLVSFAAGVALGETADSKSITADCFPAGSQLKVLDAARGAAIDRGIEDIVLGVTVMVRSDDSMYPVSYSKLQGMHRPMPFALHQSDGAAQLRLMTTRSGLAVVRLLPCALFNVRQARLRVCTFIVVDQPCCV